MKSLFKKVWQIAEQNPVGFTISVPDCQPVTKGFAIGHKATQNCFGKKGLRKVIAHSLKSTKVVGGWAEGGKFYFDTVIIVHDKELALKLKTEHKQIAIYWIEQGQIL
jgi:hypothetical protein